MIELRDHLICIVSVISGAVVSLLGGAHVALYTLCGFIVLDYVVAVLTVKYRGQTWDWDKSITGIYKKLLYVMAVIFAILTEKLLACDSVGMGLNGKFILAVLLMLNGHEMSSIARNFNLCGLTLPQWIKQIIENMKSGKTGESGDPK
jgi:toxin secretion/phage lysis holin